MQEAGHYTSAVLPVFPVKKQNIIFQILKIDCWSPYRLIQTYLQNNCKDEFTRHAALSKMFILQETEIGLAAADHECSNDANWMKHIHIHQFDGDKKEEIWFHH